VSLGQLTDFETQKKFGTTFYKKYSSRRSSPLTPPSPALTLLSLLLSYPPLTVPSPPPLPLQTPPQQWSSVPAVRPQMLLLVLDDVHRLCQAEQESDGL
jgi:hypothetical protein